MVKRKFPRTGLKGKRRFGLLLTDLQIDSEALNRGGGSADVLAMLLPGSCWRNPPSFTAPPYLGWFKFSSVRAFAVGRQKEMLVDIRVFYAGSGIPPRT